MRLLNMLEMYEWVGVWMNGFVGGWVSVWRWTYEWGDVFSDG